jgi:hypothetical protein
MFIVPSIARAAGDFVMMKDPTTSQKASITQGNRWVDTGAEATSPLREPLNSMSTASEPPGGAQLVTNSARV